MSSPIPNPSLIIDDPMQEPEPVTTPMREHEPDTNHNPNYLNPEKQDEEDLRDDQGSDSEEEEEDEDEADSEEEDEEEADSEEEDSDEADEEVITMVIGSPKPLRREVVDVKLTFPWSCLVSIESAELTVKAGADHDASRPRRHDIYGKILANGGMGKVFPFYKREQEQPQAVVEGHSHKLILCGPNYSLCGDVTYYMHVRLYEKGPDGSPIPFLVDDLFLDSPKHFWSIAHRPIEMKLDGERASLVVTFTRFLKAIPFEIRPSLPSGEGGPWTVFGQVNAIQTVRTTFERTFILLDRSPENGFQVSAGEQIPLDRSRVVSPIEGKVSGPSLTITADLSFVQHGNEYVHQLHAEKKFTFSYEDRFSRYPIRDTITLKQKHPSIDNSTGAPSSLEIILYPVCDCFDSNSDEEDAMDYEKFEDVVECEEFEDPTFSM